MYDVAAAIGKALDEAEVYPSLVGLPATSRGMFVVGVRSPHRPPRKASRRLSVLTDFFYVGC